jgi:hypothetical protein
MNVGIGTAAEQFLFWEYLFRIFFIVSLQCGKITGPISQWGGGGYFTGSNEDYQPWPKGGEVRTLWST